MMSSPLVSALSYTPASLPAEIDFKLRLDAAESGFYHFKVHGHLIDASSPRTVIYAFFEDQCVGRICPRHSLAVSGTVERILNKVLPGRQRDTGGFIDWISVFGLPETFSISLYAGEMGLFSISSNVYQGTDLSACTYLGEISGRKEFINHEPEGIQPIRVSCFGRSGSSVLMRLLSLHPELAVAGQHPYEFNIGHYYYHRCRMLSMNCQDYFSDQFKQNRRQQNPWNQYEQVHWMGGASETFFGREQVHREISHCRSTVDSYYRLNENGARYFCEKDGSGRAGFDEYSEVWPGATRIFLVRDFRDNCASILAYCAKKSTREFGLQFFDDEADWLRMLAIKAKALLERYQDDQDHSPFVFYESLINDQRSTLVDLFGQLGLSTDDAVLNEIEKQARSIDGRDNVKAHVTSTDIGASIGRWKRDLPDHLVQVMDEEFTDIMNGFGYQ